MLRRSNAKFKSAVFAVCACVALNLRMLEAAPENFIYCAL